MIPDIAVIGGGVIGLASAWRLAQQGARVALYERLQVGKEASWAAAGMLAPACELAVHSGHLGPREQVALDNLLVASRELYPALAAELLDATGIDIELCLKGAPEDWRRPGILYLGPAEGEEDEAGRVLALRGIPGQYAGRKSVFLEQDGQVDSRKLVDALRKAARNAGVVVHENSPVRSFTREGTSVSGLVSESGTHAAGGVLVAGGAWSGKILGTLRGAPFPLRPVAGQIVAIRAEKVIPTVVYTEDCYLVPRRDGRLLIGATIEENGFHKRVTAGGVAGLLNRATALFPELASAPLESHWAGLRPVTQDGLPVLGPCLFDNLWVASGHGRNGILLTPRTADLVADGILRGMAWDDTFIPDRPGLSAVADDTDTRKRH